MNEASQTNLAEKAKFENMGVLAFRFFYIILLYYNGWVEALSQIILKYQISFSHDRRICHCVYFGMALLPGDF